MKKLTKQTRTLVFTLVLSAVSFKAYPSWSDSIVGALRTARDSAGELWEKAKPVFGTAGEVAGTTWDASKGFVGSAVEAWQSDSNPVGWNWFGGLKFGSNRPKPLPADECEKGLWTYYPRSKRWCKIHCVDPKYRPSRSSISRRQLRKLYSKGRDGSPEVWVTLRGSKRLSDYNEKKDRFGRGKKIFFSGKVKQLYDEVLSGSTALLIGLLASKESDSTRFDRNSISVPEFFQKIVTKRMALTLPKLRRELSRYVTGSRSKGSKLVTVLRHGLVLLETLTQVAVAGGDIGSVFAGTDLENRRINLDDLKSVTKRFVEEGTISGKRPDISDFMMGGTGDMSIKSIVTTLTLLVSIGQDCTPRTKTLSSVVREFWGEESQLSNVADLMELPGFGGGSLTGTLMLGQLKLFIEDLLSGNGSGSGSSGIGQSLMGGRYVNPNRLKNIVTNGAAAVCRATGISIR